MVNTIAYIKTSLSLLVKLMMITTITGSSSGRNQITKFQTKLKTNCMKKLRPILT
jgi:hypothetical protein